MIVCMCPKRDSNSVPGLQSIEIRLMLHYTDWNQGMCEANTSSFFFVRLMSFSFDFDEVNMGSVVM